MSDCKPAARIGDPVGHSMSMGGLLLGAAAGILLGVATVATGGLAGVAAAAVIAGAGAGGALAGSYIGAAFMGAPTGAIVMGSVNVFINLQPATMAIQGLGSCTKEYGVPQPLASGAGTVFINSMPAGRVDEKLACSAEIMKGSNDVFFGGESLQLLPIVPEVPTWLTTSLIVVALGASVVGLGMAMAAVGVGITVAGAGGAIFGGEVLSRGGRALGEHLGLKEGYIRMLEVGGGAIGGYLGGAGAAKSARYAMRDYKPTSVAGVIFKQGWRNASPRTVAAVNKMSPEFQAEYAAAKEAGWKRSDGEAWWPPNDGAVGTPEKTILPPTAKIDRYNSEYGKYVSPQKTPFESRALSPNTDMSESNYYQYTVKKPLPVEEAVIAPWFDQPGGGQQYKLSPPPNWPADKPFNVGAAKKFGFISD